MKERTFEERWEQNILTGSAFWRVQTAPDWRVSVSGAWQAVIDGDPLSSSQYFYLGHTSGVRGYDNDVLSAEAGAYVNFEASWAPAGPRTALFAFLDAGRRYRDLRPTAGANSLPRGSAQPGPLEGRLSDGNGGLPAH